MRLRLKIALFVAIVPAMTLAALIFAVEQIPSLTILIAAPFISLTFLTAINGLIFRRVLTINDQVSSYLRKCDLAEAQTNSNPDEFIQLSKNLDSLFGYASEGQLIITNSTTKFDEIKTSHEHFKASLRHDLRTPILRVAGLLRLLNKLEVSKDSKAHVSSAMNEINALLELVDRIGDDSSAASISSSTELYFDTSELSNRLQETSLVKETLKTFLDDYEVLNDALENGKEEKDHNSYKATLMALQGAFLDIGCAAEATSISEIINGVSTHNILEGYANIKPVISESVRAIGRSIQPLPS